MKNKTCLSCITHYSCLHSILSPKKLVAAAKELGYTSLGVAELDNMSSCVEFYLECKKANIKPILGIRHQDYVYIAKNKNGYRELLNLCYDINSDEVVVSDEWRTGNIFIIPADNGAVHLPMPRFLKGQKLLFDIVVATREHTKTDNIKDLLSTYDNDWFGNYQISEAETIADQIEEYDITEKPILPLYEGQEDNSALFRNLCEQQLKEEFPDSAEYRSRLEMELEVLQSAKLENYFLVIKDIMDWARTQGYFLGAARGSAGGCLVSYLLGITQVDPIKYGLIFERFFNPGRSISTNISFNELKYEHFLSMSVE